MRALRPFFMAFPLLVTACADPCETVERLPECATCGTGQLRFGLLFDGSGTIHAATDGGVARATCDGVTFYDAALHERGRLDVGDTVRVSIGPDGSGYTYVGSDLIRFDADHHVVWRLPITLPPVGVVGPFDNLDYQVAADGGVYLAGPSYFEVNGRRFDVRPSVALDANGVVRFSWRAVSTVAYPVLGQVTNDGTGNDVIVRHDMASKSLQSIDTSGNARWSVPMPESTDVRLAPDPSGGVLSVIKFDEAELVLPGRTLTAAPYHTYVVAWDVAGDVRWATMLDDVLDIRSLTASTSGGALIAGTYLGAPIGLPSTYAIDSLADAFIARVDANGVQRAVGLPAHGSQFVSAAGSAGDDAAWIAIDQHGATDDLPQLLVTTPGIQHVGDTLLTIGL